MTQLSVFMIAAASFFGLFWPAMFVLGRRDARASASKIKNGLPPRNPPRTDSGKAVPPPQRHRGIGFWVGIVPATATYVLFCLVIAVLFWPCFLASKRCPATTPDV